MSDPAYKVDAGWGNKTPARPLPFVAYADISPSARKAWIVKGVIAKGETSSWVGAPGAGKSALVSDLAFHAAAARDWRGNRTKGETLVVYLALERGDLLGRRLIAYKRSFGIEDLPFAIVTTPIDFMKPECVDTLRATIARIVKRFPTWTGEGSMLLVIDTFAKAIAYGGGDENSAKDQNRVLGHLRELQDDIGAHIALIGHTGKDESRGARGSNAHLGDVDLMVQISGDKTKEATVIKANDQPEGRLTVFALETFNFGADEDGDPITTSIVSQVAPESEPATSKRIKLSDRHRVALGALDEAIGAHGSKPPAAYQLPATIKSVEADRWRDELIAKSVLRADDPHLRQSFYKLRMGMDAKRIIGSRDDLVWRAWQG